MSYRKATIRPYRAEDESLLFSLAREAFGSQDAWNDRAALSGLEEDTVFVADLDGDRAGYVALTQLGDEALHALAPRGEDVRVALDLRREKAHGR